MPDQSVGHVTVQVVPDVTQVLDVLNKLADLFENVTSAIHIAVEDLGE